MAEGIAEDTADIARRLERFVASQIASGEVKISDCAPFGSGYSNVTTRFSALIDGTPATLVARSEPPSERTLVTQDRDVEWAVLRHLTDHEASFIAPARWYDAGGTVMGSRTIISDFVPGSTVSMRWPGADDQQRREITELIVDLAAAVASVDIADLPDTVSRPCSWDSYIDAALDLWRRTEAGHIERNPFLRYVAAWLEANKPAPAPLGLVHGDFQPPNFILTADGIVAVDWELSHIGDVREDIAWLRTIDGISGAPIYRGNEAAMLARLREKTGLGEDVINERAIAYFSILSILRVTSKVYEQMAAMALGQNRSVTVAYSGCVISQTHDDWLQLIGEYSAPQNATQKGGPC